MEKLAIKRQLREETQERGELAAFLGKHLGRDSCALWPLRPWPSPCGWGSSQDKAYSRQEQPGPHRTCELVGAQPGTQRFGFPARLLWVTSQHCPTSRDVCWRALPTPVLNSPSIKLDVTVAVQAETG